MLVTVLAHQLDDALTAKLKACAPSTTVMFMFNTFRSLEGLRSAVVASRCVFGFPGIMASFTAEGALDHKFFSSGQRTIVSDDKWRAVFEGAGIPCDVERDMESWLHTHAIMFIAFSAVLAPAAARDAGVPWSDASRAARVLREGCALVRKLGFRVTPRLVAWLEALPSLTAFSLWAMTRFTSVRAFAKAVGTREFVALMDDVIAAAPSPDDVAVIRGVRSKFA